MFATGKEPMGPAGYHRVPIRAYTNPIPSQTTPGDLMPKGGACQNITGDQGTPGEGCHSGSSTIHRQLYISDLPGGKEGGRIDAGYKPEEPQQLCKNGALQDGRPPYITGFNPARGLDDQAGLEGCLPSSSNSQSRPTPPPIQMGTEDIPVCVSTIWADFSPTDLHKNNETCGRELRQMGIRLIIYLDDIMIMHHSGEEMVQITPLACQVFEALGLMVNMVKSQLTPQQELEFLGFLVNSVSQHLVFLTEKMRKIQQNARTL